MLSRSAAMSIPGVILSQLEMQTIASAQWALTMYSTESAMSSRDGQRVQHAVVAHGDAVVDGDGVELLGDAAGLLDLPATSWPRSLRWTWPGTNWVNELTTAMIGLPKSESFMPVARQRPRAPAMLRPWVVVRER